MPNRPIQILLVEDSPTDALLVREALLAASLHFRLSRAARLGEGIERLGERRFDVVLLDLGLPDSSCAMPRSLSLTMRRSPCGPCSKGRRTT